MTAASSKRETQHRCQDKRTERLEAYFYGSYHHVAPGLLGATKGGVAMRIVTKLGG